MQWQDIRRSRDEGSQKTPFTQIASNAPCQGGSSCAHFTSLDHCKRGAAARGCEGGSRLAARGTMAGMILEVFSCCTMLCTILSAHIQCDNITQPCVPRASESVFRSPRAVAVIRACSNLLNNGMRFRLSRTPNHRARVPWGGGLCGAAVECTVG